MFFLGALLTCFGSAYYHAAPDNPRLVWDRLPMTLGFAGLVAAAVAERVDLRLGLRSLWPLLGLGVATSSTGTRPKRRARATSFPTPPVPGLVHRGHRAGDVHLPGAPLHPGHLLVWAAVFYGLAKVFETFDLGIYRMLGGTLSGHSIKHLLAAGRGVRRRPAVAAAAISPP